MWAEYFLSVLLGAVLLVGPGVVLVRGARVPWALALAVAPGCSIALYALLALLLSLVKVPVAGWGLLGTSLAVAVLACGALRMLMRRGMPGPELSEGRSHAVLDWSLGLYVTAGVLATLLILVKSFADPAMPTQAWDNVFHLGTVRAFLDSGDWSFMEVAQYKTPSDLAIDPYPDKRFYPAAWHVYTALLADVTSAPVTIAANASNALFAGVVFPSGMFALMSVLFPDRRSAVALGAVACVSFAAFPWALYTSWQLFPNAAAMAVLPSLAFLFIASVQRFLGMRRRQLAVPFGLTLIAVAILQPNAAFSAVVFLSPYCIWRASRLPRRLFPVLAGRRLGAVRALFGAVALSAIAAVWLALYHAPALSVIVEYHWASYATIGGAVCNALVLALAYNPPQRVLALFVLIGFVASFRRSHTAWLGFSYGFAFVIFVVTTATDGALKHVLAGFWYTDPCRVGALLAFTAMPLAGLGMSVVYRLVTSWARGRIRPVARLVGALAVGVACFGGAYFVPEVQGEGEGSHEETPFEYLEKQNARPSSSEEAERRRPYSEEKALFAEEVKSVVGNAVVVNQPYDGSLYLYGVDGLHLLYRHINGYGGEGETEASRIIREHLDLYDSDEAVREVVRQTGARYVLLLAADGQGIGRFASAYDPQQWRGINGVGPDTPGFTLVLARGNMRLYRIDGTEGRGWAEGGLSGA